MPSRCVMRPVRYPAGRYLNKKGIPSSQAAVMAGFVIDLEIQPLGIKQPVSTNRTAFFHRPLPQMKTAPPKKWE